VGNVIHETVAIKVWADIDIGVVDMVLRLNDIAGCRTEASCQGTLEEGGAHPYPAHVMAHWTIEALTIIRSEFEVYPQGNGSWGMICRKGVAWTCPTSDEKEEAV